MDKENFKAEGALLYRIAAFEKNTADVHRPIAMIKANRMCISLIHERRSKQLILRPMIFLCAVPQHHHPSRLGLRIGLHHICLSILKLAVIVKGIALKVDCTTSSLYNDRDSNTNIRNVDEHFNCVMLGRTSPFHHPPHAHGSPAKVLWTRPAS